MPIYIYQPTQCQWLFILIDNSIDGKTIIRRTIITTRRIYSLIRMIYSETKTKNDLLEFVSFLLTMILKELFSQQNQIFQYKFDIV